jgi:hypothetical protein
MNASNTFSGLEDLVAALLSGDSTAEQTTRLTHVLDNDPAALDEYLRLIFVSAYLRETRRFVAAEIPMEAQHISAGNRMIASDCQFTSYRVTWRSRTGMFLRAGLRLLQAG